MEYLTLHNSDLKVSRLCMGGCPMGGYGWGDVREQQLLDAQAHIELGDDWIPALRANFGTAQIAASFGCEVKKMEGSLPACKTHILEDIEDVHSP